MYYEINVSKKMGKRGYVHFFATAERSITDKGTLKIVYTELKQAFPEPEYNISISYNPGIRYGVDPETFEYGGTLIL